MDCFLLSNLLSLVLLFNFTTLPCTATDEDDQLRAARGIEEQDPVFGVLRLPKYPRDCSEILESCSSLVSSGVYLIKPDGYTEPFEAYCDNDTGSGGWTVIQRRQGGVIDFQRNWADYKKGFGFLGTEFWLGNEKLAFLTNQALCELRIDITLENGTTCYVKYSLFRISDEWSDYTIKSVGTYESNKACQWTTNFSDCNDVYEAGLTSDGIYSISPSGWNREPFDVFCNMSIDGGHWTVIQRRLNGFTDFYRNWTEYKEGFGFMEHEFWLGNEKLYYLTTHGNYELRIDLVQSGVSSSRYSKHTSFRIGDETTNYRVTEVGVQTGTIGYNLRNTVNKEFSTYDQDNDGQNYNCAQGHRSGWWHGGFMNIHTNYCAYFRDGRTRVSCSRNNPNGDYNGVDGERHFAAFVDCVVKYTEMKIRRML